MKIDELLLNQIVELESENMPRILAASGLEFEVDKLIENLRRDQEIITVFKGEELMALLRYGINDGEAMIYSIQIRNPKKNKFYALPLLKKTLLSMKENNVSEVVSVVQIANTESLNFNKKLGLKVEKEFEKAVKFRGSVLAISNRLQVKLKQKVLAYIFRNSKKEVLVFDHVKYPEVSPQVVGGSVDAGEDLETAIEREVFEESGLKLTGGVKFGEHLYTRVDNGEKQLRHVFSFEEDNLPEEWSHIVSAGVEDKGHEFRFHWLTVEEAREKLVGRMGEYI